MIHGRFPRGLASVATAAALLCLACIPSRAGDAGAARYDERWVYCSANLPVNQSVEDVIALIQRARKDGYTAMLIADYKLQIVGFGQEVRIFFGPVGTTSAVAARVV